MEGLTEFLNVVDSPDFGFLPCYGSGDGEGYGDGYGSSNIRGSGYGYGSGDGGGYGDGDGDGDGYGGGNGDGAGCGYDNSGSSCTDIIIFNSEKIYWIDGIPTIIKNIKKQIAKGFVLNEDLTLQLCYVVKINNCYAHGNTIREAVEQAREKAFELLPVDDRIKKFWDCHNLKERYPARDLYEWHHILTGSCEMGRNQFVGEKGVDLERDTFTVEEFVKMCKDHYGGDIIKKLIKNGGNENERI